VLSILLKEVLKASKIASKPLHISQIRLQYKTCFKKSKCLGGLLVGFRLNYLNNSWFNHS